MAPGVAIRKDEKEELGIRTIQEIEFAMAVTGQAQVSGLP